MNALPDVAAPLSEAEAEAAFGVLLDGAPSEAEIEAFLVALSARGETADEIAGAARALRMRDANCTKLWCRSPKPGRVRASRFPRWDVRSNGRPE